MARKKKPARKKKLARKPAKKQGVSQRTYQKKVQSLNVCIQNMGREIERLQEENHNLRAWHSA